MYKFKLYAKTGQYVGSSAQETPEGAVLEILQNVSPGALIREEIEVRPLSEKSFSVQAQSDYYVLTRING